MTPTPYQRQRKHSLNATMNVVPYIDVMLVLLVIFMVTAPLLTTGVKVDLPDEHTDTLTTGAQLPVIVSLKVNGDLFVSYEDHADMPISQPELIDMLTRMQTRATKAGQLPVQVMVNADQNNAYGKIMALMANLQQAGVKKVGLLTKPPAKT